MSLLEVLVGILLTSLFLGMACPICVTCFKMLDQVEEDRLWREEVSTASLFIQDKVRSARAVQVWACPDYGLDGRTIEVFHNKAALSEGSHMYFKGMILDGEKGETLDTLYFEANKVFRLRPSDHSGETGYIQYAGHTILVDQIEHMTVSRKGDYLVFNLIKQTKNKEQKQYPFVVEQEGKLAIIERTSDETLNYY